METIYKYHVNDGTQAAVALPLPEGAKFLALGVQGESLVAWYQVQRDARKVPRIVAVVYTGGRVPPNATYRATTVMNDGTVCHYYEMPYAYPTDAGCNS